MNLVSDAWIPVRRRSGAEERIAPWEITSKPDDPATALATPRPDFNGALIQFLIGLLQTTYAPEGISEWRKRLREPPAPTQLQPAMSEVAFAFELDGQEARFMQDLTLEEEVSGLPRRQQQERTNAVSALFMETPTGKTLEDNTDHFVKRGAIENLCPACAATALFTLQTNAPSGGQGNLTGLRGGGPMTTLVLGDTLWTTCWLNVLDRQKFLSLASPRKERDRKESKFPWLAPSANKNVTLKDVHADQYFWAMPRRVRLVFSHQPSGDACDVCGETSSTLVREYLAKNKGIKYGGSWSHPLSPYYVDADGTRSAVHPQQGGIGYRHWLGIVVSSKEGKIERQPALVVEDFLTRSPEQADLTLWAFGYDMDNMKARCWYDSTMPLITAESHIMESYTFYLRALIDCARTIARETRLHVKKALYRPESQVQGSFAFVDARFWEETEADFYRCIREIRDALHAGTDVVATLKWWHRRLVRVAVTIFEDVTQAGSFNAVDPRRVALAWKSLRKNIYSRKLREQLGLPAQGTDSDEIS